MKTNVSQLNVKACRDALRNFWTDQLRVERKGKTVAIALPLLYPNGMQVVAVISELTPSKALLSDQGETVSFLLSHGLEMGSKTTNRQMLADKAKALEIERSGLELQKTVNLPIEGIDIHLFGEALVSIAHLIYRQEIQAPRVDHVYSAIRELLKELRIHFKEDDDAVISGKVEPSIHVDFLLNGGSYIACKAIQRTGRIRDYMEIWGYRWRDAKDENPNLISCMFYDPENQFLDPQTMNIGKSVCQVFEPYYETERIRAALAKYHKLKSGRRKKGGPHPV